MQQYGTEGWCEEAFSARVPPVWDGLADAVPDWDALAQPGPEELFDQQL
jgi:hypothetical protein